MELSFKQAGKLQDTKKELLDLSKVLDIEIANTNDAVAKSNMLETRFKTLIAIVNIEKQINNIYIKQKI
jgi:hypothetical protein